MKNTMCGQVMPPILLSAGARASRRGPGRLIKSRADLIIRENCCRLDNVLVLLAQPVGLDQVLAGVRGLSTK